MVCSVPAWQGTDYRSLMAHGMVRAEIEIAVCLGWLSVDIHLKLRTPPCGDGVQKR